MALLCKEMLNVTGVLGDREERQSKLGLLLLMTDSSQKRFESTITEEARERETLQLVGI